MNSLLRYLLACLLVLSIPVQGFAASRMLFCATAHHSQDSSEGSNPSHASKSHFSQNHGAHTTDQHHSSNNDPHRTTIAETNHSEVGHASNHSTSTKHDITHFAEQCPACDLCCNVCAVPPTYQAFAEQHFVDEFFQIYQLAFFGPTLEGLKRPPRAILA
jgi:hypothetical protein